MKSSEEIFLLFPSLGVFKHSTWAVCFLFWALALPAVVHSACTFPSGLTGTFVRSRDSKSLTFTSNTVSGLAVLYNSGDIGDFNCDTLSSGRYIIASGDYNTDFGTNRYYICWQFVTVTSSSFILYELSDDLSLTGYAVRPGETQSSSATVDPSTICTKTTSTTLFTTLVKNGASESDVASDCPTAVQANFQYGSCGTATLQACANTKYVTADYATCNEQVFGSAGGVVSCMGSAIYQSERYINLYLHDAGNSIICWKIPDTNTAADMSTTYYSGDCTTTGSGSTALALTYSTACSSDTETTGSGGDSAGAIAGGVVGGIAAISLIALLVFCVLTRGNKVVHVGSSAGQGNGKDSKENGIETHEKVNIPKDTKTETKISDITPDDTKIENKIPEITPRGPSGLPPIDTNGKLATGEPLRG